MNTNPHILSKRSQYYSTKDVILGWLMGKMDKIYLRRSPMI